MINIVRSLLVVSAVGLSGCVSVFPETAPPSPRYHIEAVSMLPNQGAVVDWSLVVEDRRTTRVYDSARIAVTPAPGKIQYLASAEWADRAPRLFQTALVQTFEDTGRILSVGERSTLPIGDVALQTDIRALHLDVRDGVRAAKISVYARLSDGRGTIYAAKKFDASQIATSDNGDDVVAAFNGAFEGLITQITNWTFDEGSQAVEKKSAKS